MTQRTFPQRALRWVFPISPVIAGLIFWLSGNVWIALVSIPLVHAFPMYAILRRNSRWLGPVVTSFDPGDRREVWLTIDDGPSSGGETEVILDLLQSHQIQATFYTIGKAMKDHPAIVERIVNEGHSLGNHTMSHHEKWFWSHFGKTLRREIDDWYEALPSSISPDSIKTFRSPVGMKPHGLYPLLESRGLTFIGWNSTGLDGITSDIDKIFKRLTSTIRPGSIIVFHEARGHAPELLERLLPWLEEQGLRCVIPEGYG